jgi:EAL domain-containing protein (putative c-di-GMP-specific phosphodiesterase class I)
MPPRRGERSTRDAFLPIQGDRHRSCTRVNEEASPQHRPGPISAVAERVAAAFSRAGALGVVMIDARALEPLERRYGADVHDRAIAALAEILDGACQEVLPGRASIARGEVGRGDIVALIPCALAERELFAKGLSAMEQGVRVRLARQGGRAVYPYLRELPPLGVGRSYVVRNPMLALLTQVRDVVEAARADADLNHRIAARARRRHFDEILVNERVHSVYEPIVDARSLTVFGYEALVRGPDGTPFASPGKLFEVASEEGLLFEFDCLCRRAAMLGAIDFPEGAKLFMNIRPSSFHDPGFQVDALVRTLSGCGLEPKDVVFEISEQESIDNYDIFREKRDAYGKLGFQFALDDTGVGYSSLEAVAELTPEFIKVDRVFVSGIDQDPVRQTVLRSLQSLARELGARIVGEGLDTLEELRMLDSLGIEFGQGWLFGKPGPLRADGS